MALTDVSGKAVQSYEYDSFGNQHDMQNRIKQPYGYTGREHDRETGLRYYRARYYDGEVGRFISEDPIGFNGGDFNLYAYVWSNPAVFIDPWGLAGLLTSQDNIIQNTNERGPWPTALTNKYPTYFSTPTPVDMTPVKEFYCENTDLIAQGANGAALAGLASGTPPGAIVTACAGATSFANAIGSIYICENDPKLSTITSVVGPFIGGPTPQIINTMADSIFVESGY